jgi:hypothetical protein
MGKKRKQQMAAYKHVFIFPELRFSEPVYKNKEFGVIGGAQTI